MTNTEKLILIAASIIVIFLYWSVSTDIKMDEASAHDRLVSYCKLPSHIETLCEKKG